MEPVRVDLLNNIIEITKEELWADVGKHHDWMCHESKRVFDEYAPIKDTRGYVYLIAQERDDKRAHSLFVKIGRTSLPPHVRMGRIQGQNPVELKLLGSTYTDNMHTLESDLHRKFRKYSTEKGGKEWFEFPFGQRPQNNNPEWYKYFLPYQINPAWFPLNYFDDHPDVEFFAVLRKQERRLRMYHEMNFIREQMREALRKKGLLCDTTGSLFEEGE